MYPFKGHKHKIQPFIATYKTNKDDKENSEKYNKAKCLKKEKLRTLKYT